MATIYSNIITVSSQAGQTGTNQCNLQVLVEDLSGAPVAGATVTVDGKTQTTDSSGIAGFCLPAGNYTITASAPGYYTSSKVLNNFNGYVTVTIIIEKSVTTTQSVLWVTVNSMSGDVPIAGATVSVDGQTKTTDSSGKVWFYLSNGTYTVTASAPGYNSQSLTVKVIEYAQAGFLLQPTGNCTYNINATVDNEWFSISPTSATVTPSQGATFTVTRCCNVYYVLDSWILTVNGNSTTIPVTTSYSLTLTYSDLAALQPCSGNNTYSVSLVAHTIPWHGIPKI